MHPPATAAGALDAWDPLTGKRLWTVPDKYPRISGVLSTKGNLVFSVDIKGIVSAYDASSGTELWRFNTGSGTRGGIISYMAGGEQYVLVPSGIGSAVAAITAGIYPEVGQDSRGGHHVRLQGQPISEVIDEPGRAQPLPDVTRHHEDLSYPST